MRVERWCLPSCPTTRFRPCHRGETWLWRQKQNVGRTELICRPPLWRRGHDTHWGLHSIKNTKPEMQQLWEPPRPTHTHTQKRHHGNSHLQNLRCYWLILWHHSDASVLPSLIVAQALQHHDLAADHFHTYCYYCHDSTPRTVKPGCSGGCVLTSWGVDVRWRSASLLMRS